MASHAYLRFILKTPDGFLKVGGTTYDLDDKDIIVLNIYEVGGIFASKETKVSKFFEYSNFNKEYSVKDCMVMWYACPLDKYVCSGCWLYNTCGFINHRKKCKFSQE